MSANFKNWCNKPEVVCTGEGWGVRINGCDVFDSLNEHGVKTLRSFDIASGLETKDQAEASLKEWLTSQL